MRRSTYFRIFVTMALIMFVSFSLLGGLSTVLSYRRTFADRLDMMISVLGETVRYVSTQHLSSAVPLDDMDLNMSLTLISRVTNFDIILTDAGGTVVAFTDFASAKLGSVIPGDILLSFDTQEDIVEVTTLGGFYPVPRPVTGTPLAASIGGEMRLYGYLFITSDMAAPRQEWISFTTAFVLLALSVLVFTFIVLFVTSKWQVEPLNEMADAARRFARGDYSARVATDTGRKDEIAQLTEAFNNMADAIEHNEELRRDFIANLSHELKTPMTVIAGFAEGLLDGTIPRKDEDRYLKIISSETRRLSRLVKSMLAVSTLGEESEKLVLDGSFDITEIAAVALLSLENRVIDKKLLVEAKLPEEPIAVKGNKDAIIQVLYNLLDNAVKYSPIGGTIQLELWRQDKRVYVSVTNHGETIPAEELPNIFQRFHKVDRSRGVDREGVGLGLYIAKTILDNHNEDIFVSSDGGITKFIFSLTLA